MWGCSLAYIGMLSMRFMSDSMLSPLAWPSPIVCIGAATRYVEAKGQAYTMQCLRDQEALNEEELACIYKRGRNHRLIPKLRMLALAITARQQALKLPTWLASSLRSKSAFGGVDCPVSSPDRSERTIEWNMIQVGRVNQPASDKRIKRNMMKQQTRK